MLYGETCEDSAYGLAQPVNMENCHMYLHHALLQAAAVDVFVAVSQTLPMRLHAHCVPVVYLAHGVMKQMELHEQSDSTRWAERKQ